MVKAWLPRAGEVPVANVEEVPYPILPPTAGDVPVANTEEVPYPILPPTAGDVPAANTEEVPYPTLLPTTGVVELVNKGFPNPTLAIDDEPKGAVIGLTDVVPNVPPTEVVPKGRVTGLIDEVVYVVVPKFWTVPGIVWIDEVVVVRGGFNKVWDWTVVGRETDWTVGAIDWTVVGRVTDVFGSCNCGVGGGNIGASLVCTTFGGKVTVLYFAGNSFLTILGGRVLTVGVGLPVVSTFPLWITWFGTWIDCVENGTVVGGKGIEVLWTTLLFVTAGKAVLPNWTVDTGRVCATLAVGNWRVCVTLAVGNGRVCVTLAVGAWRVCVCTTLVVEKGVLVNAGEGTGNGVVWATPGAGTVLTGTSLPLTFTLTILPGGNETILPACNGLALAACPGTTLPCWRPGITLGVGVLWFIYI